MSSEPRAPSAPLGVRCRCSLGTAASGRGSGGLPAMRLALVRGVTEAPKCRSPSMLLAAGLRRASNFSRRMTRYYTQHKSATSSTWVLSCGCARARGGRQQHLDNEMSTHP